MPSVPRSPDSVTALPDPVLAVLQGARELLTPEGAWCQGEMAFGKSGRAVDWSGKAPVSFCLAGALLRAAGKHGAQGCEFVRQQLGPACALGAWNDQRGRTQAQVLALLDSVITTRMGGVS